jgi:sugar fermentation stimulation protein A
MLKGKLIKRYKRFLADIELTDGQVVTVHCPNSGSMTSCATPGSPVIISDSENPKRKLQYTWEMIKMGRTWVGVNTSNPNRAVTEFIEANQIPELQGYSSIRREVKYGREGRSRIDILLGNPDETSRCYVEVKNATMRVSSHAAFPDAVTTRGRKHLEELRDVVSQGHRGVMFFFVGRNDCKRFRPADEVDPEYGKVLRLAVNDGVELLAYRMRISPTSIQPVERLPVDL